VYAKSWDLISIMAISLIATGLAFAAIVNPVTGLLFGLPLLIFFPGYAITTALAKPELGWFERITISFGLSIALTAVGGLFLNLLPWGLQPATWAIYLSVIALGFCVVAQLRREKGMAVTVPPFNFNIKWAQTGLLILAVALTITAVIIARRGADYQVSNFTQLWLIPAQQNTLEVGITNMESQKVTYRVDVVADNNLVRQWAQIELEAGKQWEVQVDVANYVGANSVKAVLYRLDKPDTLYRGVHLTPKKQPGGAHGCAPKSRAHSRCAPTKPGYGRGSPLWLPEYGQARGLAPTVCGGLKC
jgi:uncharacterized membrane protein